MGDPHNATTYYNIEDDLPGTNSLLCLLCFANTNFSVCFKSTLRMVKLNKQLCAINSSELKLYTNSKEQHYALVLARYVFVGFPLACLHKISGIEGP